MQNDGILIVFDGIDGAGKTTQVNFLSQVLSACGEDVLVSKEPTAGKWGQLLRDSAFTGRLPIGDELELFLKDRQEHLNEKIRPALKAGRIVILDRYFYSTFAYQGILVNDLKALEVAVRKDIEVPDIAFVMELSAESATYRISKRDGKPNEFERIEDLEKIGELFHEMSKTDKSIQLIDGSLSRRVIHTQIVEFLIAGPLKNKRCAKSYGCDDQVHCIPRIFDTCDWWGLTKKLRNASKIMIEAEAS